jgi:hypothetical protein
LVKNFDWIEFQHLKLKRTKPEQPEQLKPLAY